MSDGNLEHRSASGKTSATDGLIAVALGIVAISAVILVWPTVFATIAHFAGTRRLRAVEHALLGGAGVAGLVIGGTVRNE